MDWLDTLRRTFLDLDAMGAVLPQLLGTGLKNTLVISVAATVLGTVIGMVLAIMGISRTQWLRVPARIYTDVFRGLPAILTILLIGQGFSRFSRDLFGPSPTRWASSRSASSRPPTSVRSSGPGSRAWTAVSWRPAAHWA